MRTIFQGLLLSSMYLSAPAWTAEPTAPVSASAIVETEEEIDAKTVAELTAALPAAENRQPAQELLAGEMKIEEKIQAAQAPIVQQNQSEDQIPVLTKVDKLASKSADPMTRLVMSMGILLAVTAGLYLFARFWAKRKTGLTQHHQIKVLTQYGLGPKKSLAIIRVAGESILIGITDHNISMIKSLALLDEDLPMEVPQQFSQELDHQVQDHVEFKAPLQASAQAAGEKEDFSFGSVRDMVASRLREMRSL
ncbi:MAG: FliO/MopB family protein [Bdellovibrionales bacterium]